MFIWYRSRLSNSRKWSAALQMVEEKARSVLARSEFASLCYYTDEYAARHMGIEAYVQVVLELLNTPEKVPTLFLYSIRRRLNKSRLILIEAREWFNLHYEMIDL